jgi:hypothetical protein
VPLHVNITGHLPIPSAHLTAQFSYPRHFTLLLPKTPSYPLPLQVQLDLL